MKHTEAIIKSVKQIVEERMQALEEHIKEAIARSGGKAGNRE